MEKGLLHSHLLFVTLFLSYMTYITLLLVLGKKEQLDKARKMAKIPHMVISSLLVLTGVGIMFMLPAEARNGYLWVKLVLTIAIIPLGIIGFKKESKAMALASLALAYVVMGVALAFNPSVTPTTATTDTAAPSPASAENADPIAVGLSLYTANCVACHGIDGKLAAAGAKDLSASTLTDDEKKYIITHGKGLMSPYKDAFSPEQIDAVVSYINTLKGK